MTVAKDSVVPVQPVNIPGPATLSFRAKSLNLDPTTVVAVCSLVGDPTVEFDGPSPWSSPPLTVHTSVTQVAFDVRLRDHPGTPGRRPSHVRIHGDVLEGLEWQFDLDWWVPIANPTPGMGTSGPPGIAPPAARRRTKRQKGRKKP